MTIWNVPIEPLQERYSAQWMEWYIQEFHKKGLQYITVHPNPITDKIERGSFLDVAGTHYYKAQQLAILSKNFFENHIKDNDIIFLHDIWWPGLEALAYMRDGLGVDVKICGCIFAGTYDPFDFTAKKGMGYWGKDLENSWFRILDKIFVATEFHKRLILEHRDCDPKKLVVTGHPMYPQHYEVTGRKEDIVVFPHRLDSEKNPQLFDKMASIAANFAPPDDDPIDDWQFIKTKEVCKTKQEYYDLLQRAKISVSFADQETLGFAMIESIYAHCIPLVPDRLSYSGLFYPEFKYGSWDEFLHKLDYFMYQPLKGKVMGLFTDNRREILHKCTTAIDKMIVEMEKLSA